MSKSFFGKSFGYLLFGLLSLGPLRGFDFKAPAILEQNLGTIQKTFSYKPFTLSIEGDKELAQKLKQILGLHGGLKICENAKDPCDFQIQIRYLSSVKGKIFTKKIQLSCQSGIKTLFNASFDETQLYETCNQWIAQCCQLKGFFSTQLAFVRRQQEESEVYTSDLLFQNVRKWTNDKVGALRPRFHPGGKKIIYTSYIRTGFAEIYLLDLEKNTRTLFAGYKGTNHNGVFSPSGREVLFTSSATNTPQLYLANTSGKILKQFTYDRSIKASPAWFQNENKAIFVSSEIGFPQLYLLDLKNKEKQRIAINLSRYCVEPAINPVNEDIIVFTAAFGGHFSLVQYQLSTKAHKVLTQGNYNSQEAVWLADGRHLIYTRKTPTTRQLYLLDTLSGQEKKLSPDALGDTAQCDTFFEK